MAPDAASKNDYKIVKQALLQIGEEQASLTEDDFKNEVKQMSEGLSIYLEEKYVDAMVSLGEIFDKLGVLEIYAKQQNGQLSKIGLTNEELMVKVESEDPKDFTLKDLFSEAYLKRLKTADLNVLNIFWQNRLAKEVGDLSNNLYFANYFDVYGKIERGEQVDLPRYDEFITAIQQKELLEVEIGYKIKHSDEYLVRQDQEYYDGLNRRNKRYQNFNQQRKRSLAIDISKYMDWHIIKRNVYSVKDNLMYRLITDLEQSRKIKNWGVILQEETRGTNDLFIGIDYPGYNFPCMVHGRKEMFIDALKGMRHKTLLPIYDGNEDRILAIKGEEVTSKNEVRCNVLMPVTRTQKTCIKREAKDIKRFLDPYKDDPYSLQYQQYKMIDHLIAIADGDYPTHLKQKVVDGKKEVYVRPKRRYIDISIDRIYETDNPQVEDDSGDEPSF